MTCVVTENCIPCKRIDCADICPVEAFHEGPNFLVINPDECIDREIWVPGCPAEAVFTDIDLPPEQKHFLELNAELAKVWPLISGKIDPLPDAGAWNGVEGKLQ